jgi:hypothetical protein
MQSRAKKNQMNPMNKPNPKHQAATLHPDIIKDRESDERIRQMFRDMGLEVPSEGFGLLNDLGDTGALLTLGIAAGKAKEEATSDE